MWFFTDKDFVKIYVVCKSFDESSLKLFAAASQQQRECYDKHALQYVIFPLHNKR